MIDFAMTTPVEDVEVHHFPLEIISEILQQVKQIKFFCSIKNLLIKFLFLARI
jgi:hypothetical protein